MKERLLIRVAAGKAGWGHLMRCLAMAQAWRELGGEPLFALRSTDLSPSVCQKLTKHCVKFFELTALTTPGEVGQLNQLLEHYRPSWLVLDGYEFDDDYQATLNWTDQKLIVFDDNCHASHRAASGLINGNAYATSEYYQDQPDLKGARNSDEPANVKLERPRVQHSEIVLPKGPAWRLLGPKYLALRQEFWEVPASEISAGDSPLRIAVAMGGSPSGKYLDAVLASLDMALQTLSATSIRVDVIAGVLPNDSVVCDDWCRRFPPGVVELHVDPPNVIEIFSRARIAVSAGGSTLYELARCGVPTVALAVVENQKGVVQTLGALGVVLPANDPICDGGRSLSQAVVTVANLDVDARQAWQTRSRSVVDGQGARRIARVLSSEPLGIRRATLADSRFLFELRNDELVRENSLHREPIEWAGHECWLTAILANPNTVMYLIESRRGERLGQVRFDLAVDLVATVSISLAAANRGWGIAGRILLMALEYLLTEKEVNRFRAVIRTENIASQRIFSACGFLRENSDSQQAWEYWRDP